MPRRRKRATPHDSEAIVSTRDDSETVERARVPQRDRMHAGAHCSGSARPPSMHYAPISGSAVRGSTPGDRLVQVGAYFRPAQGARFFAAPSCEFTDRAVALEPLWGRAVTAELERQLDEAPRDSVRVRRLEAVLHGLSLRHRLIDAEIRHIGGGAAAHRVIRRIRQHGAVLYLILRISKVSRHIAAIAAEHLCDLHADLGQ